MDVIKMTCTVTGAVTEAPFNCWGALTSRGLRGEVVMPLANLLCICPAERAIY